MLQNDVRPTLYYCNPNIYPEKEYLIRKNELTRYAEKLGLRVIDDDHLPDWQGWDHYHNEWLSHVCGLENEPERGKRCLECFRMRLLRAAKVAEQEHLPTFTTTLASSRWKSLDQINEAGLWAASQVSGVTFDTHNWRKGGLQERRNQLLREEGFYNQLYCGCEFSLAASQAKETEQYVQRAVAFFKQGYNCSQSVAMAFADKYGIPEALMARLSASFGGGIGRMRETCGSACGMFLLAGLEVTNTDDRPEQFPIDQNPYPDQELKKQNYAVVQRLAADFKAQTGSIICKELLGLNKRRADGTLPEIQITATPEARTDEYYRKRPCIRMVETAVRIYMKYLHEKERPTPPYSIVF